MLAGVLEKGASTHQYCIKNMLTLMYYHSSMALTKCHAFKSDCNIFLMKRKGRNIQSSSSLLPDASLSASCGNSRLRNLVQGRTKTSTTSQHRYDSSQQKLIACLQQQRTPSSGTALEI